MIRIVRVLSHLHYAEEAIAIEAELAVDLRVDLERHASARLLQLSELALQGFVQIVRVRIVDSCIQDGPTLPCGGTFKVPVAEDMGVRLAVSNGVVSRY